MQHGAAGHMLHHVWVQSTADVARDLRADDPADVWRYLRMQRDVDADVPEHLC
jgi:hypothetical protein